MSDNGKNERLIERTGSKVLQQIVISLVEVSPGVTATNLQHNCPSELECRGLFDKGRVVLDEHWRLQSAPKIVNPQDAGLARSLLKHLKGDKP